MVVAAKIRNPNSKGSNPDEPEESKKLEDDEDQEGEGEDEDEMVAIKKIVLANFTAGMIRRTLREIKILRLL